MTNVKANVKIVVVNNTSTNVISLLSEIIITLAGLYIKFILLGKEGEISMIFLDFKKQNVKESDKQRNAKIIARVIPILIRCNKSIFSVNKNSIKDIDIETKLIFR